MCFYIFSTCFRMVSERRTAALLALCISNCVSALKQAEVLEKCEEMDHNESYCVDTFCKGSPSPRNQTQAQVF